jgi:seryl-tRNA synthetase
LRAVECPFKNIGCIKIIKACDVQTHVVEDAPAHLLLAVNRMTEHQDVIKKLHVQVQTLENENKELKSTIEKKEKESKEEISKLGNTVTHISKELSTLEKTCKREFAKRGTLSDS